MAANKLLLAFFLVPGSHDIGVLSRLIKNMISYLTNRCNKYIVKDGYTDFRVNELYINRLLILGKIILFAKDFIIELVME